MLKSTQSKRFFFGMMGSAYRDETVTTLYRLTDAALEAGHFVDVWCCGGGVHLADASLGDEKPRDISRAEEPASAPTTAALITALARRAGGSLRWNICRYCAEERGLTSVVPEARIRPSLHFPKLLAEADVSVIMGRK